MTTPGSSALIALGRAQRPCLRPGDVVAYRSNVLNLELCTARTRRRMERGTTGLVIAVMENMMGTELVAHIVWSDHGGDLLDWELAHEPYSRVMRVVDGDG